MKTLEQIQTFLLVAELNSFVAAANTLGISAAAVGKQIKVLEKEVNANLFYRTTRNVQLSELGNELYYQYKSLMGTFKNIEDQIANYNGDVQGQLSISSPVHMGETYIIPFLNEFMSLYPNITVDLDLTDRIPDLILENRDLIIGLRSHHSEHYVIRDIMPSRYIYCAAPQYIQRYGSPTTPQQLTQHHMITHTNDPSGQRWVIGGMEIKIAPKLRVNSTSGIINVGLQGLGIIQIFEDMVKTHIANGTLIKVLTDYEEMSQPLYLFYKKVTYLQPKIRKYIDFFMSKIRQ